MLSDYQLKITDDCNISIDKVKKKISSYLFQKRKSSALLQKLATLVKIRIKKNYITYYNLIHQNG